jgi:hypothetical protein
MGDDTTGSVSGYIGRYVQSPASILFKGVIMIGLLELVIVLVIIGFIVWILITYVPMPPIFRTFILVIVVIAFLMYLLNMVAGRGAHVPL